MESIEDQIRELSNEVIWVVPGTALILLAHTGYATNKNDTEAGTNEGSHGQKKSKFQS